MQLEIIVPTYNRQELIPSLLKSLLDAPVPPDVSVKITIVDNNSTDQTAAIVREWQPRFDGRLQYLFEPKQGRSHALNAGVTQSSADLIGFVDDDEQIDPSWYRVAAEAFSDPSVDFIGGPYLPNWSTSPPKWLPSTYRAVIGWLEAGKEIQPYGESFDGMLMGGNAIVRRHVFQRVGLYATHLGRSSKGLLCGEDEDFYHRLIQAGACGFYRPDLIIYHYIPKERLTRSYYRRWSFWRAVTMGVQDRERPSHVKYLLGVPRWFYRSALHGLTDAVTCNFRGAPDRAFAGELDAIRLIGFMYGKYVYKPAE